MPIAVPPPFPGAQGVWVKDCSHVKSFGRFRCRNAHSWTSAHAYNPVKVALCKQQCTHCGQWRHAWCLWQNSEPNSSGEHKQNSKPHRAELCERCVAGVACVDAE